LARVGAKYASPLHEKQQDLLKAFQFYSQAAQYGHAGSNYELGVMYDSGVPGLLEDDPVKAAAHFARAASCGLAPAQFNLGLLYETGRGVEKDALKAIELWEHAAASRHPKALTALGERYFHGKDEINGEIFGSVDQDVSQEMKIDRFIKFSICMLLCGSSEKLSNIGALRPSWITQKQFSRSPSCLRMVSGFLNQTNEQANFMIWLRFVGSNNNNHPRDRRITRMVRKRGSTSFLGGSKWVEEDEEV
jgi:hypothetical protein